MAFKNGHGERIDDLRFSNSNPRSPPEDSPFSGYISPPRGQSNNNFMSALRQPVNDTRASLQRRFTEGAGRMSSLTPIGQQPAQAPQAPQAPEAIDLSTLQLHKVQLFEKRKLDLAMLAEKRRQFEAEFDAQEQQNKLALEELARDLTQVKLAPGAVSEPTTPPEYRDQNQNGFPSLISRPNRFSMSKLSSPQGGLGRFGFSTSQLVSPPPEPATKTTPAPQSATKLSAKSMPGSRRNSEEEDYPIEELPTHRSAAMLNRYSMPVQGFASQLRNKYPGFGAPNTFGHINTTGFLFGDDEEHSTTSADQSGLASPDIKSYLQLTDDKFPTLIRRDDNSGLVSLSANSAALDLANSQSPAPEEKVDNWPTFGRNRPSHHSMPQNSLGMFRLPESIGSPPSDSQASSVASPVSSRQNNRHSVEFNFAGFGDKKVEQAATPPNHASVSRPGSLQPSYSTNDLPTMKTNGLGTTVTPPKTHAEQQFHNHNASLGRIPPNAMSNRQSRDFSAVPSLTEKREEQAQSAAPFQSALQASAPPFGPQLTSTTHSSAITTPVTPTSMSNYGAPSYYGGYGYQYSGSGQSQMGSHMQINNQIQQYQPQNGYGGYQGYSGYPRMQDSQARVMHQRRLQNGEEAARFANVPLEHMQGEIYGLCKDQHGCRYLQRKLEERNPESVQIIFNETKQHVVELMTDPFGNYLCQKLLEYSNDDQRTELINYASPQMVKIALNQHGTRALQKMIEFISTPEQTQLIIHALQTRVVDLVQDLNGNHVIQKCLNRLSTEDSQFIFNEVGEQCVIVGTHRHGCCVLQRCIDHATGHQRARLIAQVTDNAFSLVQDPFGNYVVQYILDLAEPAFTEPLCQSFRGKIPALSKQKFSSNVMEKCIRVADSITKRAMIEEMINPNELEKMLRDSFANYVVQTAMEYADPEMKIRLTESIRPLLPAIRQTPHGRRIQTKILGADGQGRMSGFSSGPITPVDPSAPGQFPVGRQMNSGFGLNPPSSRFQGSHFENNNAAQYLGQGFSLQSMDGNHFAPHLQSHTPANHSDASTAIFSPQATHSHQNGFLGYEHAAQPQPYSYF